MVTAFSMWFARKTRCVAVPDERSSHDKPTPRLGGLGYFVPISIALGYILINPGAFYGPAWGLPPAFMTFIRLALICGALALLVGILDDYLRLPPGFKLIGQLAVAILFVYLGSRIEWSTVTRTMVTEPRRLIKTVETVYAGAGFDQIALTQGLVLDPYWQALVERLGDWAQRIPPLPVLVTILWIVIVMNAYNFMDGTDGLAGAFAIAVAIGLFAVYIPEAAQIQALRTHICFILAFSMVVIGVSLGFLFYNWPPASTFLGDGGSQYVGFLLAAFLAQVTLVRGQPAVDPSGTTLELVLHKRAQIDFLACLILLWPFLYDVLYTLVRRTLRLKAIWRAHHEHLYQRLNDTGWSHRAILYFSFPFYLAHAAIFYLYAWAPTAGGRRMWAAIALLPMILYTMVVIACETTARSLRAQIEAAGESHATAKTLRPAGTALSAEELDALEAPISETEPPQQQGPYQSIERDATAVKPETHEPEKS
jgi:UDP-N-acetylmuramyl pentapeptide phosphotransferase/UDP-N-acetylglucosamine-1-phosphate transferase